MRFNPWAWGFCPLPAFRRKLAPDISIPKSREFRLDFSTLHRGREEPFEHAQLHVTMQPLRFMEFSLENVQQAVLSAPKERCW